MKTNISKKIYHNYDIVERSWDANLVKYARAMKIEYLTNTEIVKHIESSQLGESMFHVSEWGLFAKIKMFRGSESAHDYASIKTTSSTLNMSKVGLIVEHNRELNNRVADGKILRYSYTEASPILDEW